MKIIQQMNGAYLVGLTGSATSVLQSFPATIDSEITSAKSMLMR